MRKRIGDRPGVSRGTNQGRRDEGKLMLDDEFI